MSVFFAIPNKTAGGEGDGRYSAFDHAMAVLTGMQSSLKTDIGGNPTDPWQLDAIISAAKDARKLASTPSEIDRGDNKVKELEAKKSMLAVDTTRQSITDALKYDAHDSRYLYVSNYAGEPYAYLTALNDSYSSMLEVGQSIVDDLIAQGNPGAASDIADAFNENNDIINIYREVSQYFDDATGLPKEGAEEFLKNFATVYTTDLQGNIRDQKVMYSGEVPGGFVPVVGKDGNNMTMDGMLVYVNKQMLNGESFGVLGKEKFKVISSSTKQLQTKEEIEQQASLGGASASVGEVAKPLNDNLDMERAAFRDTILPSTPATPNPPGTYYRTADDRVFRSNEQKKFDEVTPEALSLFPDYRPQDVVRVPSAKFDKLKSRSGRVITPKDFSLTPTDMPLQSSPNQQFVLKPNVPFGGQTRDLSKGIPSGPDQNMTPVPGMSTNPAPNQSVAPQSSEVRTNRQSRVFEPTGSDRLNRRARSLFSGNPGGDLNVA